MVVAVRVEVVADVVGWRAMLTNAQVTTPYPHHHTTLIIAHSPPTDETNAIIF